MQIASECFANYIVKNKGSKYVQLKTPARVKIPRAFQRAALPCNLQLSSFKIKYRPGRVHRDADGLSRMPMDFEKYIDLCTEETSQEFIKAAINAVHLQDKNLSNWVTSFATDPDVLDFDPVHKAQNATSRKEQGQFETTDILQAQLDDKNIQRVIELKKSNSKPDSQQRSLESKET